MSGKMQALTLVVAVMAAQPFISAATSTHPSSTVIVQPKQQRPLWIAFVDGAARDIDGEWTSGGHVAVLRRANTAADEPLFGDIVYTSVWRGIHARISAARDGLKYSFEVSPGADPRVIHLRYSGADRIELTDAGEITLDTGGATIVNARPTAYQQINGRTTPVPVRFVQFESDVAFSVGAYDRTKPLLIDLLQHSSR
jgi:hypothetical protein